MIASLRALTRSARYDDCETLRLLRSFELELFRTCLFGSVIYWARVEEPPAVILSDLEKEVRFDW